MKKTLALVLAFALVFSTMTVAFAEDAAISADAKICADLGMLIGDGSGVTTAYTATAPTRIQSAVMFLRLKGLEAEAKAFTGEANFADADKAAWAKPYMAYLKANPQLGWQGDGTNFSPTNPLTAKEYYKVMLQALGYVQSSATVAGGDFSWDNVVEFAATKGLTKVATVTNFTINDVAVATVEALKANMKEGGKTLVASLVDAGKVDKAKAIAAGIYSDAAATTTAKLDSVKAVGNTVVLVEYKENVEKAFAENVANFKIAEAADAAKVVEVKAAVLDGTKQVVLNTAELTAGKSYTITAGAESAQFVGVSKDAAVPEVDEVEGTDTNRVNVTFTKKMDLATALNPANYAIAGVTVKSVAWDDDVMRDSVVVTTEGLVSGRTYKMTVSGVKSVDQVTMKSATETFSAKSDKSAPKIDDATEAVTNTRILVVFKDDNEVTKESAENLANYKVTVGSGTDTLEITAAKLVENSDGDLKNVELTTASQKAGQKYVVTATNIVDTSVLANTLKTDTADIRGKKVDTNEPTLDDFDFVASDIAKVSFKDSDDARMDFDSMLNVNNYALNNSAVINNIELTDAEDADCVSVLIKIDGLEDGKTYKLTVNGVADEYGNKMENKYKSKKFDDKLANTPSKIKSVNVVNESKIEVTFTGAVKEKSAENEANYSISGGIGTPKKAVLNDAGTMVTLTTASMNGNSKYTVTVNGVVDEASREMTDASASYYVASDDLDIDAPEIEDVEAINDSVVKVSFNEAIYANSLMYVYIDTNADGIAEKVGKYAQPTDDALTELEFTVFNATYNPGAPYTIGGQVPFSTDGDATILWTNAEDYQGNVCDDTDVEFEMTADDPELVEVASWEQYSVKQFKVEFTDRVWPTGAGNATDEYGNDIKTIAKTTNVPYALTLSIDKDDDHIVWLTSSVAMEEDKEFKIDFSSLLTNNHGVAVKDSDDNDLTEMSTSETDEEEPYIDSVVVKDRKTIELTFNEDLVAPGDYKLYYVNKDGDTKNFSVSDASIDKNVDQKVVTLDLGSNELESRYTYDIIPTAKAKDVAGNFADWTINDEDEEIATIDGVDNNKPENYIMGYRLNSGSDLRFQTSAHMPLLTPVTSLVYGTNNTPINSVYNYADVEYYAGSDQYNERIRVKANLGSYTGVGGYVYNYIPLFAFAEGTNYTITIDPTNGPAMTYTFEGMVDDDMNISYDVSTNTYSVTYDDMETGDVVAFVYNGAVVAADTVDEANGGEIVSYSGEPYASVIIVRDANVVRHNAPVLHYVRDVYLPNVNL